MGVLDRFEKGIERAVSGAFAKAFRSEVQPVEIASALRREVDDRAAVVDRDRTLAPNSFVVELGSADYQRLGEWQDALADELRSAVQRHASQQAYGFVGPIRVTFEQAEDLDTGLFRVRSSTVRARSGARRATAGPPPAGAGGAAPVPSRPDPDVVPTRRAEPPQAPSVTALEIDGRVHRLTRPVTVLGRSSEADIILDDPGVSRRHAEIHVLDGRPRLVDLGSTNGTFVDGERVHAEPLADGSTVTMGRTRIIVRTGAR
ncbi:MAG: DUF3662 domain-containing protein [Actinomycetales bacterium]|nr:DUF3662 domain-containing protein [Actinomycetales bacterium]